MSTENRKAWDADTMGFGKHDYRHVDPSTINPEDYALNLEGEQERLGDVREYNSAANQVHPETDCGLDWLGRIGTVIETAAPGYEGQWMVVQMPIVRTPNVFARLARIDEQGEPIEGTQEVISCVDLGVAVDETNHFRQVRTVLVKKGKVDKSQRERLTKR